MGPLPKADLLIHAGDFMNGGRDYIEILQFNQWLKEIPLPKEKKLICAGNHDILFDEYHIASSMEKSIQAQNLLTEGTYLQDEEITIEGVKFYFSPWTPYFMGWGFNVNRGPEIKQFWNKIPDDVEVLVTHDPPRGILDKASPMRGGEDLGCEELEKRITQLKNLKLHVFGHIHGGRGIKEQDGITYVNASFLTEAYKPWPNMNGYTVVEI